MLDDLLSVLRGQVRPAPDSRHVRTYSRDMGWTTTALPTRVRRHEGFFHCTGRRWRGMAFERGDRIEFWIQRPPIGLIRGTKWEGCFHALGQDGWWAITFVPGLEPRDVDSGLSAINRILQQCFRRAGQRRW